MSKKLTTKEFIKRAIKKHENVYDYSLVNYLNKRTKVIITCKTHGKFEQLPLHHIKGSGCPKCVGKNKTNEEFILELKNIHGDRYNYSKVNYVARNKKIIITCLEHGDFEQIAYDHLFGYNCPKCNTRGKNTSNFIKQAANIHGDKYNYSKVIYENCNKEVIIICDKHGEFEQKPTYHLNGRGCQLCKESKGEKEIRVFLEKNNIEFIPQHRFNNCKNIVPLPFDFYLPEHNICIEYQGRQHYIPIDFFGGEKALLENQYRDKIKKEYCKNNNIPLISIKHTENIESRLNEIIMITNPI